MPFFGYNARMPYLSKTCLEHEYSLANFFFIIPFNNNEKHIKSEIHFFYKHQVNTAQPQIFL